MPLDTGGAVHPRCFNSVLVRTFTQISVGIEAVVKSIVEAVRALQEDLSAPQT